MIKKRIWAVIVLIIGLAFGFFVFQSEPKLNKNYEESATFFKKFLTSSR